MTMMGSNRPCMGMVLVSGAKTSMPHGVASHRAIEAGDFVTIDYGANIRGYLSDMSPYLCRGLRHGEDEGGL